MRRLSFNPSRFFLSIAIAAVMILPAPQHASAEPEATSSTRAAGFKLFDQYGKQYQIAFPREKVSVLVFADKRGSAQVEGWVRPLYERYKDRVLILGVAQLAGAPDALQPMLRSIFRRSVKYSVMMDWTGAVSRSYQYPGKDAMVVVIDRRGTILHRQTGKAEESALKASIRVIDSLAPAPPKKPGVKQDQSGAGQGGTQQAMAESDERKE